MGWVFALGGVAISLISSWIQNDEAQKEAEREAEQLRLKQSQADAEYQQQQEALNATALAQKEQNTAQATRQSEEALLNANLTIGNMEEDVAYYAAQQTLSSQAQSQNILQTAVSGAYSTGSAKVAAASSGFRNEGSAQNIVSITGNQAQANLASAKREATAQVSSAVAGINTTVRTATQQAESYRRASSEALTAASEANSLIDLSTNQSLASLDTSYYYLTENIKLAKQGNTEAKDYLNNGYWWAAGASAVGSGLSGYAAGANL